MRLYDNAPKVAGTVITLMVFSYVLLPMRFYTRLRNKTWGLDDTCMAVAIVPFSALSAFCLAGSFKGLGVHEDRMNADEISEGLMMFFFFEIFYCAAIIPIKLSISFMLMRIASPRRSYVWSLYGVSILFSVMSTIAFFFILFHCKPVQFAWDTTIEGGSCGRANDLADVYYATTAINIATDWFCAVLPVPLLWSVQLNRNAKVSVACLLSLGVLASLSACIRLNYTINLTESNDYLYGVGDIVIWGYAENGIGLVVGCVSTLRPLFRRMFHLGGSTDGKSAKQTWPQSDRRAYHEFESGYEMPHKLRSDKVDAQTTVRARRSSDLADNVSEEHILRDVGGIQISRSVLQEASYSKTSDESILAQSLP
ncbi:hypothetical protein AAFC00_000787 [Neodothiora populina]|uniref:Rhodopsin domain-containing protein n=1 Tax=Neodothiora populina TaxID=2781224 RepID=A0ABR3PLQ7_9PEZI